MQFSRSASLNCICKIYNKYLKIAYAKQIIFIAEIACAKRGVRLQKLHMQFREAQLHIYTCNKEYNLHMQFLEALRKFYGSLRPQPFRVGHRCALGSPLRPPIGIAGCDRKGRQQQLKGANQLAGLEAERVQARGSAVRAPGLGVEG